MTISTCKGCGAAIVWARSREGKNMPLNEPPVTLWLVENAPGEQPKARAVAVRTSHFATCPQAAEFRRG